MLLLLLVLVCCLLCLSLTTLASILIGSEGLGLREVGIYVNRPSYVFVGGLAQLAGILGDK